MTKDTPVTVLPFVGPKYATLLEKLGIETVGDLLYHLPHRYLDLSKITPIDELLPEEIQVVEAEVRKVNMVRLKGGRTMVTATAFDDSGTIQMTWFNQPFMEKNLQVGQKYRFAGEVGEKFGKWQLTNPQVELASKPPIHTGRLVPVYHQTAGISSKWLRARVAPLMGKIPDITPEFLPADTLSRHQLPSLPQAINHIHMPESLLQAHDAKHRLAFDELLLLQLAAERRKSQWQSGRSAPQLTSTNDQLRLVTTKLPFALTAAQQKVLHEILADMALEQPMNRLLEGDVGSGKTIVALLAALVAVKNGFQVAVMAPTSVLAQQHFLTFQKLLMTLEEGEVTVSLRTAKSKMEAADITIGTHALLSEGVTFETLGLVIIDEQHRFGVEQRATLMAKGQQAVHLLTMTATPIPRTLALTAYGDLQLSVIDEMPVGRLPIKTHIVPERKRSDMYGFITEALNRGDQAYVICPLVEESDNLQSVKAATTEYERLCAIFPNHKLALLHGKMKAAEKDATLEAFKQHEYDLLVATPVVEVGIDVPNATMLLIEGAERFGLAQLHQLRGRVGRGSVQSYCFLLSDSTDALEVERLRHLEQEQSGIKLAEVDLQTRGPGEVYGIRQSGLPELKAASFFDTDLIEATKAEAELLWSTGALEKHPTLAEQLDHSVKQVELN